MAHTITITNPRTIALIEEEAAARGLSPAEAVDRIIADRSDRTASVETPPAPSQETPEERAARLADADRILSELQAMVTDEDRAFDYDAWLYDENGLPH
ncbi:MAG: type II toxin-antitoxin system VapB family antitoxin [Thermomicrobiales bacterium]